MCLRLGKKLETWTKKYLLGEATVEAEAVHIRLMTVLPEEWEMIMNAFCLSPSYDLYVPKYVQEVKPVIFSSLILREYIFSHVFL